MSDMEEFGFSGSLVTRDPFTQAELEKKLARQRAEKAARDAEKARVKAEEKAAVAANREANRLRKEAALAEQIKQRTAAMEEEQRLREEREAREQAAEEARLAKQEQQEREQAEAEAKARALRQRQAEQQRADKERRRREEKEAAKRAVHEARMQQMRAEDERAERFAAEIAETRRLSEQLEAAKRKGSVDPDVQMPREVNSTDPEQRRAAIEKMKAFVPEITEEPLAKPSDIQRDQRKKELELRERAERDRMQREEEERLKSEGMQGLIGRLKMPTMRDEALLEMQRQLVTIVAKEGMEGICKRVRKGTDFDLKKFVKPVADVVMSAPGCIPGIMILGLLQFAGDQRLTEAVMETYRIPSDYNQWLGELLGCQLFFAHQAWKESGTSMPWRLAAEQLRSKDMDPSPFRDLQRQAAAAKVEQLATRYNGKEGASSTTKAIMVKFEHLARVHDNQRQRMSKMAEEADRDMQEQLDVVPQQAKRMLEDARRRADELQTLRNKIDFLSEQGRRSRGDMLRTKAQADAARESLATSKQAYFKNTMAVLNEKEAATAAAQ